MLNDDIEILDDFSDSQTPNTSAVQNQSVGQNSTTSFNNDVIAEEKPNLNTEEAPAILWDTEVPNPTPAASSAPTPIPDVATNAVNPNPAPAVETKTNVVPAFEPVSNPTPVTPAPASESVSEFEKMVNEAHLASESFYQNGAQADANTNFNNQPLNNQSYENGFYNNSYAGDANNDLIQSNGQNLNQGAQDLTITAVYPNGLAVDKNEEIENTQVIKPKKKSNGDLPLIIIVAVLAITLVVLLIVFYL